MMKRAAVGVVNPTGMTENCPGSALEFQACGVPVVSAAKGGLWDTVDEGNTGILVKNITLLSAALIHILENKKERSCLGDNASAFVARKFDYEAVCCKWLELFEVVLSDEAVKSVRPYPKSQFWRERRWLRIIFRFLIIIKMRKV